MQKELFYNRNFDVRCGCSSTLAIAMSARGRFHLGQNCLVTVVHCVLLDLIWQQWIGLTWEVVETLTGVPILLPLKLPILLPLPYLQMLLVPLIILTFWLLHVQTWIYARKAKITAAFVPDGFEPIPASTDELNSASEVAKGFLISKTKMHST